jgi:hypothetical protein
VSNAKRRHRRRVRHKRSTEWFDMMFGSRLALFRPCMRRHRVRLEKMAAKAARERASLTVVHFCEDDGPIQRSRVED